MAAAAAAAGHALSSLYPWEYSAISLRQSPPPFASSRTIRLLRRWQVAAADGCHLDRRTLKTVKTAGFATLDAAYTDLSGFYFLNPCASGLATA